MINEKKTAMQQLISELKSSNTILSNLIAMGLCEKYLAIEKQQIVEAYVEGCKDTYGQKEPLKSFSDEYVAECYYSQTYNQ